MLKNARILGAEIDEEELTTALIKGLPSKYNIIALQIDSINNPTIDNIRRLFELYQERYCNQEKYEHSSAYKVYNKNKYKHYEETKASKMYKCFICHKQGHKANVCWHNPENNGKTMVKQTSQPGPSGYKANTPTKYQKAIVKEEKASEFAKLVKERKNLKQLWILESGASSHMTSHFEYLEEPQDDKRKIILADNSYIKSQFSGNVKLRYNDNEPFILKDVLHVPDLNENILSVSKIVEDNKRIIFDIQGKFIIDEQGRTLIEAKKSNDFYIINSILYNPFTENDSKTYKTIDSNWDNWHKRLCHINKHYMHLMKQHSSVYNFNYNEANIPDQCITCIRAKSTRLPFKEIKYNQSKNQLDLLHLDLIGPIKELSIVAILKERGGRPIKFEDAELEALLDEDSSQTQEELAETLGVTQQAISNRLKVMGMVQKQGNWVPYELKPGTSSAVFARANYCSKDKVGRVFCIES
ncbi:hypothetical protein LAZ67_7000755 [Cordylochernes scorpioides]|uniref:HTH cro/C1-type domain-containing protein n=1 Tax=Cordylochernes scorpioides TaxID=51811 RepID=A0ABY6KPN4_9ARAC|nr:hypothetical protein LAZ67_7000755 [Cordylochernes scorpioides]